jgi:hypothetical protein
MFKNEFNISLPENHDENILLDFIQCKGIEGHLKLMKKTSNNKVHFRYLMDSRMGVIYVSLRKEKKEVSVEIKESLYGLFPIAMFFISGLGLLLFHKVSTGAFLMGMSLVYLYFIYYNFKEARTNLTIIIKKELDQIKH